MPGCKLFTAIVLLAAVAPGAAAAQDKPDCRDPQTQTGMNICAHLDFEAAGFMARGGSMESMIVSACMADRTRARTQDLKDQSGN